MDSFKTDLAKLLKARFPYIYISTPEEYRIEQAIQCVAADERIIKTTRKVYTWTATDGFVKDGQPARKTDTKLPMNALNFIEKDQEAAVYILMDFHIYFGGSGRVPDYQIVRKLRDLVVRIKKKEAPQNVIFVSPLLCLPDELQKDVTILDFDLPDPGEIRELLREMIDTNKGSGRIRIELNDGDEEKLVNAALGLTLHEAENAFARAMVEDGCLDIKDVETILEEKCQIIKKSQILEYIKTDLTMKDVGGLNNLKNWLRKRNRSWMEEARKYCLPAPKGILIAGVPGCGKSLCAKSMSAMWQLPLLRLDVGRVYSGIVGSSEENIRRALRTSEAVAPSILWIDEIEKGFGSTSSAGDSGTSSRVFGTFLTWMQEKEKPVFVVATANKIKDLPPEFMRKGRFDEIFFVDLPTRAERFAILRVHLERRLKNDSVKSSFNLDEETFKKLVDATEGFSGAEIEQVVISALFEAFSEDRGIVVEDVFNAVRNTVPLSITQAEEILKIREWANVRAVSATSTRERSEYASAEPEKPEAGDEGEPDADRSESMLSTRGGRTIDF